MSKSSELVKNTFILGTGRLSTQFLSFLLLPLYTTYLTPTDFGQLDIILIYISLLAPVLTLQMDMAVFRHLIDARGNNQKTIGTISSATSLVTVGVVFGSIALGLLCLLFNLDLVLYLVGLFVSVVIVNYLLQVVRGLGRNKLFAISSFIIGITSIVFTVVLVVVFRRGIEGVLLATIIANLTGTTILIIKTKIYCYIKIKAITRQETTALLNYSWPLIPSHIALWGIGGISRTIVVASLGFAVMGIFAAAAKLPLIYTALYGVFAMSWTEAASVHINDDKDKFFSRVTNSATRFLGSLAIFIIAAISLVFPLIMSSDFSDARQYIPLLIISAFLGSIVTHYGAIYLAARKTKQVAAITLQAVIISTVLTIMAVGLIGLYAPAIALIITYSYMVLKRHKDIQQYVTIQYNRYTYPALCSIGAVVILLYYMNNIYSSVASILVAFFGGIILNRKSFGLVIGMFINKLRIRER